ncbi:fimbrial biogenesis chaperone [Pseudomonas mucidolens]|uniref:fimbrial biogenesis chaperone n=1 Tax=Pseudomonas mucidolens TaxID=46679 RepID=UPI000A079555|nr:fimbria/pilus periplasmic chaperone [Pseudomonas mucidolens]
MTPITRYFALVIGVILMGILPGIAQAAIVVQGARVVFSEKSHEVAVRINNTSAAPVLLQSWVDDGQATVSPEDLHVPFIVAPAVSRVDPSSAAVLRISVMQPQLPNDRESLFWLNVLETPPRSPGDETVLQFFSARVSRCFIDPCHCMQMQPIPVKGSPGS